MKLSGNSDSNAEATRVLEGKIDPINSTADFSAGSTLQVHTEQQMPTHEAGHNEIAMGFFMVGAVINIVMITAYFIWAYKQWDKKKTKKG